MWQPLQRTYRQFALWYDASRRQAVSSPGTSGLANKTAVTVGQSGAAQITTRSTKATLILQGRDA